MLFAQVLAQQQMYQQQQQQIAAQSQMERARLQAQRIAERQEQRYQERQARLLAQQQHRAQSGAIEEIVLDGSPETAVTHLNRLGKQTLTTFIPQPVVTPPRRRGRPRLDPDDDDVISTANTRQPSTAEEMAARMLMLHQANSGDGAGSSEQ